MSNNMCSIENGGPNHSIASVTSSFSSPSLSKPFSGHHHLFPNLALPLPDTAFPFPPPPIFLSSLLPQHRVSSSWFIHPQPPPLSAPLSLTANDLKESPLKSDSLNHHHHHQKRRDSSSESLENHTSTSAEVNLSMNESERNSSISASNAIPRQHSDNLSWLADVAISSRASGHVNADSPSRCPPSPSMESHSSMGVQRNNSLFNPVNDAQRMYSPRFQSNNSSIFHFQPQSTVSQPPLPAHFPSPYMSPYYHQQFSPTAQSAISPFIVPNATIPTTRAVSYQNSVAESYHHALLNATAGAIQTHSALANSNSRSPSMNSSDSPSMSGPFSSPTISSGSPEQSKSLLRNNKDPHSPDEDSGRSDASQSSAINCGIKRKSPNGSELNNNIYKLPTGKEGSLKHRILKPPNINIDSSNHHLYHMESAPLSAPPIPGVRRDDFIRRIAAYGSSTAIPHVDPHSILSESMSMKSLQNSVLNHHQRRKSVPQSVTNNTNSLLVSNNNNNNNNNKHNMIQESSQTNASTPNENSAPLEPHSHSHLKYPIYFQKGSIIQLANGKVKFVEEMSTQDFIDSAIQSPDLCADCSEVLKIEDKIKSRSVLLSFSVGRNKVPVEVEAPLEHPFFVFHQGWSSCSPERSLQRYGLKCRKLKVGDVCVSLTPKPASTRSNSNKSEVKDKIDNKIDNKIDKINRKFSVSSHSSSILTVQNERLNVKEDQFQKHLEQLSLEKSKSEQLEKSKSEQNSNEELEKRRVTITNTITNVPINSPLKRNRRHSAPDNMS